MLTQIHGKVSEEKSKVCVGEAVFPRPFTSGLEFNAPVHGTWNIVHTGMLIPQAHQVYICSINCNRGVVMTAAEMGALDRFSTITILEKDIVYGDLENLTIQGVTRLIEDLPQKPRMMMIFPSCVQHFMGTNMEFVYEKLEAAFPDIVFARCWMDPTMQRHALPPEQRLRREMYRGIRGNGGNKNQINILGGNLRLQESCDLKRICKKAKMEWIELSDLPDYATYERQGDSCLNLVVHPVSLIAAKELQKGRGMAYLYLPLTYDYEEIMQNQKLLEQAFGLEREDTAEAVADCNRILKKLAQKLEGWSVAIDQVGTTRPLGLAKLLLEHGIQVKKIYLDVISPEEERAFLWLKQHAPLLELNATVHYQMRVRSRTQTEQYLAIGQKAAYFTGTSYFVNMIEGGGMYGFDGIQKLAAAMGQAIEEEKDTRAIVPRKGLGCDCIL